jgi:hypothetical protein
MKRNLAVLAVCFALVAGAVGQELPSSPYLPLSHRGAFLLTNTNVQKEVGLDSVQRTTVAHVMAWLGGKQTALLQAKNPNDEAIKSLERQASDQLLEGLSVAQREALERVTIRAAGYPALVEPEVVKRLHLSDQQVVKIRQVLDRAEEPEIALGNIVAHRVMADPQHANAINKSYEPERARRAEARKAEDAKALEFLSEGQVSAWHAIGG